MLVNNDRVRETPEYNDKMNKIRTKYNNNNTIYIFIFGSEGLKNLQYTHQGI